MRTVEEVVREIDVAMNLNDPTVFRAGEGSIARGAASTLVGLLYADEPILRAVVGRDAEKRWTTMVATDRRLITVRKFGAFNLRSIGRELVREEDYRTLQSVTTSQGWTASDLSVRGLYGIHLTGVGKTAARVMAAFVMEQIQRINSRALSEARPSPRPASAPPTPWVATHRVPEGGMESWDKPDGSRPVTPLSGQLELRVIEQYPEWAFVEAANGWTGWVDGRRLESLEAHEATEGKQNIPGLISQLAELQRAGAISTDEFERKKAELLARL